MVLAISLIIMLILAILGSSAIKTTVVQERATGLTRNKQVSFDSSEAALRLGEINADSISVGAATDGSVGLWLPDQPILAGLMTVLNPHGLHYRRNYFQCSRTTAIRNGIHGLYSPRSKLCPRCRGECKSRLLAIHLQNYR